MDSEKLEYAIAHFDSHASAAGMSLEKRFLALQRIVELTLEHKDTEIARLTAALAESEAAREVADAGWAECMEEVDNLLREIDILKTDSGIPF
jgi:hypothetical protein